MLNWTLPLTIDRVLTDYMARPQDARSEFLVPRADVLDTGEVYQVIVELPGVPQDQVTIDFEDDTLTIRGQRTAVPEGQLLVNGRWANRPFVRQFTVGGDVDRDHIAARLDHGLLTVTLPRKEEVKPRRIEVQTES